MSDVLSAWLVETRLLWGRRGIVRSCSVVDEVREESAAAFGGRPRHGDIFPALISTDYVDSAPYLPLLTIALNGELGEVRDFKQNEVGLRLVVTLRRKV